MQPLPDHLRPMSVGDIHNNTVKLYRQNFLLFAGVAALVVIPVFLLQLLPLILFQQQMFSFPPSPNELSEFDTNPFSVFSEGMISIGILLSIIQSVILLPIMYGALTWTTARRFQQQPVSILGAYSYGRRRMLNIAGAAGMVWIAILVIFAIPIGLTIFAVFSQFTHLSTDQAATPDITTSPAFTLMPLIFLFQIGGYVVVLGLAGKLLFLPQAVVIEGRGPLDAFRRSWQLTNGFYWRTIGIILLITLLTLVVFFVFGIVAMAIIAPIMFTMLSSQDTSMFNMMQGAVGILNILIDIITYPAYAIAFTLAYYDILARREGIPPEPGPQEELPSPGDLYRDANHVQAS